MSYQDKTITCVECGQPFTFSAEDQAYHAQKGYTNEPKRCAACREARRMGGGGGGYSRSRRQMFDVTCSQCGKATQVPFQPRGDRPVYCSDCYSKQSTGSRRY